jgi:predicted RNA-binding protein YlqC (UPF0109 family)
VSDLEPEDANLVDDFEDEDDDELDTANLKDPARVDDPEESDEAEEERVSADTAVAVLEYLVKAVVEEPDGVEVDVFDRRGKASLEVHVAQGDMGRVIGKRGLVAQSIRTVVRAAAVRDGVEVDVEFVE